ncbi:MAG: CBS domain-containing protein [bacterium]
MNNKVTKDLLFPLSDYAVVPQQATLAEAILLLRRVEASLPPDRQTPRAVLVSDAEGKIVGQLGHLDFLRALEPKYDLMGDLDTLSRAGVSDSVIDSLTSHLSLWQGTLSELAERTHSLLAADFMHPLTESIDIEAPLTEAMHKLIIWQTPRVLVTRKGEVVGVLRAADLFAELAGLVERGKPEGEKE